MSLLNMGYSPIIESEGVWGERGDATQMRLGVSTQ